MSKSAEGRFDLGVCYLNGLGVDKNAAEASKWFKKALAVATAEDLALILDRGPEFQGACQEADMDFEEKCSRAAYNKLEADTSGGLFAALLRSAKSGRTWSQYWLALAYKNGYGVDEDVRSAAEWLRIAADGGLACAVEMLARFYKKGMCSLGADEDKSTALYKKAFEIYLKQAETGNAYSQYKVAEAYEYGFGVGKNEEESFKWMLKAAQNGLGEAMEYVSLAYSIGEVVGEDHQAAFEWYVKAAEHGVQIAQSTLAYYYYRGGKVRKGIELEKDFGKSFRFAKMAVEQHDDERALRILAQCYYHGNGVEEDNCMAFEYFKRAAEKGEAVAMDYLGDCYYNGFGTGENKAMAKNWYEKAAKAGVDSAKESLNSKTF